MRFLFCFFITITLAFGNLQNIFEEIVDTNSNLKDKSAKELIANSQKKLILLESFLNEVIKSQIKQKDYDDVINTLKEQITINQNIGNLYLAKLKEIELNTILAHQILENSIYEIQTSNTLLENKENLNSRIQSYIDKLNKLQDIKLNNESENLQNNLNELLNIITTCKEILRFLALNEESLLSNSIIDKLSISHVLGFIESKLNTLEIQQSKIISKIILSAFVFIMLFLLKGVIANLIVKTIALLSKFLQSNTIQCRIKAQINRPIITIITILSIQISLAILIYPNNIESKYQLWFNFTYILSFAWFFILLFKGYIVEILGDMLERQNNFRKEVMNLILKTMYFVIFIITLLALLKNFGFNISAIVASLGIGGIAVALAIKDTLANFFASIIVLVDNSFNQGDLIACGDVEGVVVEMGLRRTTIRTFDNALLFVPNSILANASIRNWNRRKAGRMIRMTIGVTYSAKLEQIQTCIKDIKEMLEKHPKIAKSTDSRDTSELKRMLVHKNIVSSDDLLGYKNTIYVGFDNFGDSSLNILVHCFSVSTQWGEWMNTKEEICYEIFKIVEKNNLSFAFPSQSIYIESMPK